MPTPGLKCAAAISKINFEDKRLLDSVIPILNRFLVKDNYAKGQFTTNN